MTAASAHRTHPISRDDDERRERGTWATAIKQGRRIASLFTMIVDPGLLRWGVGATIESFALLALAVAATAYRHDEGWAWWAHLAGKTLRSECR